MTKCLDCSKFSETFHPLNAKVEVNGFLGSIETHALYSKRIRKEGHIVPVVSEEEVSQYPVVGFVCNGFLIPYTYFQYYVGLLWYKYLNQNTELVEELKQYDEYQDFNQFTDFSHAKFIELFMDCGEDEEKVPGDLFYDWLKPLIDLLTKENSIIIEKEESIRQSITEIVCFFTREGEKETVETLEYFQQFCPVVYRNYKKHLCKVPLEMYGGCFVQDNDQTIVQRLKNNYNKEYVNDHQKIAFLTLSKNDEELDFRTAVQSLKNYAQQRKLSVSLPYNLGCKINSERWERRYEIMKEIFSDYYVMLFYKD